MPNLQPFPKIFNDNFSEVLKFFEGDTIRYFFWNPKIFLRGREQLDKGHKKIEYDIQFY